MKEICIISAVRTPVGNFGGALASLSAVDLGVIAAKEAIKRAGIRASDVEEVVIGNVLSAGLGQNPARQIAIHAGIPQEASAMTLNKLCGSGLRTVSLAAQIIKSGDADVVLAGGAESMSNAAYVLPNMRWGAKMGDVKAVDTMIHDGLTETFNGYHMGITAENIVDKWNLTREELDDFAAKSQNKAERAQSEGRFKEEIVSVEIPQRRGGPIVVDSDEFPKSGVTVEKLAKLRPAFKKDGVVTAGNSSGINDGAAMVIVMSKQKADELGLKPMATIKSYATAGLDPQIMGYGPVPATKKALEKADMKIADIDLIEANEAFAAQSVAVTKDLKLNPEIVNVNGGAISLGHPIGASGARVLTTLLHEMQKRDSKTGLATLCIGGGMGVSMIVER